MISVVLFFSGDDVDLMVVEVDVGVVTTFSVVVVVDTGLNVVLILATGAFVGALLVDDKWDVLIVGSERGMAEFFIAGGGDWKIRRICFGK